MTTRSPEDRTAQAPAASVLPVPPLPPGRPGTAGSVPPVAEPAAPDRAAETSQGSPTETRRAQPSPLPPAAASAEAGGALRVPGGPQIASGQVTAGDPEVETPAAAFSARAAAGRDPAGGAFLDDASPAGSSAGKRAAQRAAWKAAVSHHHAALRAGRVRRKPQGYVPGGNRRDPAAGGEQR